MPTTSGQQIIYDALVDLVVVPANEATAEPEDEELGLRHLNRLIKQLAANPRYAAFERNEAFTITTSQQSYTFGPSGNFVPSSGDTARPAFFTRAKLVRVAASPDDEVELPILNVKQYAGIAQPAQSATEPLRIYYQPTYPTGTLWPVPYPTNTSNKIRLYWMDSLAEISLATIGDDLVLPGEYIDLLHYRLMRRLCVPFGKKWTDEMQKELTAAEFTVARNAPKHPPYMATDVARSHGGGEYALEHNPFGT